MKSYKTVPQELMSDTLRSGWSAVSRTVHEFAPETPSDLRSSDAEPETPPGPRKGGVR